LGAASAGVVSIIARDSVSTSSPRRFPSPLPARDASTIGRKARLYVGIFKLLDGGLRDGGWMGEDRPKGGHALAILPGLSHYNLAISPLFAAVTLAFLDEQPS
jgi:hypothetical protein